MEHSNPELRTLTSQHRDQRHLENRPAPWSRPEEADEKAEEAEASPPHSPGLGSALAASEEALTVLELQILASHPWAC